MSQQSEAELQQPVGESGMPNGVFIGSAPSIAKSRKKLIRRTLKDRSQGFRHSVQVVFVMLNIGLGFQFCVWTRYYETAGKTLYMNRPAGVEGWLPIAGMMNTKYLLETHSIPQIHPAAMFLFLAFLASSLLLKKAFCSWLCPIGTLSELLWKTGEKFLDLWASPKQLTTGIQICRARSTWNWCPMRTTFHIQECDLGAPRADEHSQIPSPMLT
ncbi:MAG TPA: 4Fe-4S binding protein [Acidobacteriaceae bacterium]|nr:4Fe-4S binding protein [Acidobacteriaceae bacterium]